VDGNRRGGDFGTGGPDGWLCLYGRRLAVLARNPSSSDRQLFMTLTRGQFLSYDFDRMVVLFTMIDDQTDVHCAISTSAMDNLDPTIGAKGPAQREAQFLRLRDQIEKCAAQKYLEAAREGNPPGLVLRSIDFR
jgi:hypothetical protein